MICRNLNVLQELEGLNNLLRPVAEPKVTKAKADWEPAKWPTDALSFKKHHSKDI
jgi:hypothetical protein